MRNVLVRLFSFLAATYLTIALWPLFLQGTLQLTKTVDEFVKTVNSLEIVQNGTTESKSTE